ncbi:MAG: ATP-grasp domain-containing protein [Acidobacteria bacterium]|nr:MAG: ATP-grasp domain-containing protein [Acidobacteriota bacterium]
MTNNPGALVIGGNYRGLSISRSLGRNGIAVWVTTTPDQRLASLSRYTLRSLPWIDGSSEEQVAYLLSLAERYRLDGWVLFPTDDESAALIARFQQPLSRCFRGTSPEWDVLRWAYDKRLTYRLAAMESIDYPWTFFPRCEGDLQTAPCPFPVILKPAIKASANRFTVDKAWPAENRDLLLARYREALELVSPDLILVQEMIPGGGDAQFSFTALCSKGEVVASVSARRTRQYPIHFGHSSSFVETLREPEIEGPARRLLAAMGYTGVAEIEFKYDRRDHRYKLLDINPRIWTWSPLCGRAGVDYPYLLWRQIVGKSVSEITGRAGVRWVRMSTDVAAAWQEILRGRLNARDYLRSLQSPLEFALFAADDPLPALLELPLMLVVSARKLWAACRDLGQPGTTESNHARSCTSGEIDKSFVETEFGSDRRAASAKSHRDGNGSDHAVRASDILDDQVQHIAV